MMESTLEQNEATVLEQKVAVITGASQGIGAALVKAYRDRNYRVVATARSAKPSRDWGAFLADLEWIATSAETEKDGQLVQNISNELLAPTAFSSVK